MILGKERFGLLRVATFGLCIQACALSGEDDVDDIGQSQDSLLNGQLVNASTSQAYGLAGLPGCSAVLVSSRVAITAEHCVAGQTQATITVFGQSRTGTVRRPFEPIGPAVSGYDLAAITFTTRVNAPSTGQPWRMQGWGVLNQPIRNLVGSSLICYGRGFTAITNGNFSGNGSESYHSGVMPVDRVEGTGVELVPGPNGWIPVQGDSGGPCFYLNRTLSPAIQLVGVFTQYWPVINDMNGDGIWNFGELAGVSRARVTALTPSFAQWLSIVIAQAG